MLATPADFDEQRAYCKMHIDLRHGGAKEGFSYGGKVGDWRLCLISSYCGRVRACVGGWWLVVGVGVGVPGHVSIQEMGSR